ncbi:hypothetical protein GCM10022204_07590 [Microlunatus aurantiacus]|uniref:Phosphotransferase enzyme family protein n=1 Tax=Microlunatus aurantiacus TaxID=446786 RepID=A0ABP7CPZ9_9ACTN
MSTMTSTPQTSDRPGNAGPSTRQGDGGVLAGAVRAGLVTARELADGVVELRGSALLLHGRPIGYARGAASAAGGSAAGERRPPSHEPTCLRLLAETGLVAEVHGDGTGEVVWTSAIPGESLTATRGTMADLAEVCQGWGAAIANLHGTGFSRATDGGTAAPEAPRPWVLDPDRPPRTARPPAPGSARAYVLRILRGDRGLRRAAARVADRWTVDHWIHGDLTGARVLVRRGPELQVRFVDLRESGRGDQGWDLAGALETVAELTAGPRAPWGSASGACLADYLMQGYRRSGGAASVDGSTRALRMVARAWSLADDVDARSGHPASLHPAAGHWSEASRLTERLALARELAARSARGGLVAA